jgi:ribosome biogenesis GTPase / thiamine phosphate phosphatase
LQWREGVEQDNQPQKERWSREARNIKPKVEAQDSLLWAGKETRVMVISMHRRTADVAWGDFAAKARFSPNFSSMCGGDLVVGDFVFIDQEAGSGDWFVLRREERVNYLGRTGPEDRENVEMLLAANVDLVVLVMSATMPEFNHGFADRFMLMCRYYDLPMALFISKCDLLDSHCAVMEEIRSYAELANYYFEYSLHDVDSIQPLYQLLSAKKSLVAGPSGAGKSSLISKLYPHVEIRTGEVRAKDGKGKHTTTSSRMYALNNDTWLIDTPGVKALGMNRFAPAWAARLFPGFEQLATECKFPDCMHRAEPGCKVKVSLEEGFITQRRYRSYLRVLASLEE